MNLCNTLILISCSGCFSQRMMAFKANQTNINFASWPDTSHHLVFDDWWWTDHTLMFKSITVVLRLITSRLFSIQIDLEASLEIKQSGFFYGCETWKVKNVFNECLMSIIPIPWPDTPLNTDLWDKAYGLPLISESGRWSCPGWRTQWESMTKTLQDRSLNGSPGMQAMGTSSCLLQKVNADGVTARRGQRPEPNLLESYKISPSLQWNLKHTERWWGTLLGAPEYQCRNINVETPSGGYLSSGASLTLFFFFLPYCHIAYIHILNSVSFLVPW